MPGIEIVGRGVFVSRGKLLVCHGKGASNVYLPGGHVEFGEGAETAVCREISEELGKTSRVKHFLGCVEHTFRQKGRKQVELNLVFEVEIDGLDAAREAKSEEGHLDFQWRPLKDLRRSNFEPACLRPLLAAWRRRSGAPAWASSVRP